MIRPTTNGVLKSYRYNLMRSTNNRNKAQETVLTGRKFNSFAEDPATAASCFQMRRSLLRVNSQISVSESVIHKYEVAWSTLDTVINDVDNMKGDSALTAIIKGASDPTGTGRTALGQQLEQIAESIVLTMNAKYGENYVYAGADGLELPFELTDDGKLLYRGQDVTTGAPGDLATLDYLANGEKKFADIGLGLEEDANGKLVESSAYNVALSGISYLGYGETDGMPNNIVCIINRMGQILKNCEDDGSFQPGEEEEFSKLFDQFNRASDHLSDMHTQMDARAAFLKDNQKLLEHNAYTLQEQIVDTEDVDSAEAITEFSWAQYCYNAALKVGNSILSESLMDYLRT